MARTHNKVAGRLWTGRTARDLREHPWYVRMMQHWLIGCEAAIAEPYGLYRVQLDAAFLQFGHGVTQAQMLDALVTLHELEFCAYDPGTEFVWIFSMVREQLLDGAEAFKPGDWRIKSAQRWYETVLPNPYLGPFHDANARGLHLLQRREWQGAMKPLVRGIEAPSTSTRSRSRSGSEEEVGLFAAAGPTPAPSHALIPATPTAAQIEQEQFDAWWDVYPLKTGKGKARQAWSKHRPPFAKIMDTTRAYLESREWAMRHDGSRAIPYPATFLNGGMWDDTPTPKGREMAPPTAAMVDRTSDF